MATDGAHLPVFVPAANADVFRGRKGLTQNVLASCSFDLQFTYVLAGWEGTAADGKIMADALSRDYRIDEGYFDLGDAGFALTPYMLTPYRGVRYHLNEWAQESLGLVLIYIISRTRSNFCIRPQNKEELFNLRHSRAYFWHFKEALSSTGRGTKVSNSISGEPSCRALCRS
jgi:hypothetical protein